MIARICLLILILLCLVTCAAPPAARCFPPPPPFYVPSTAMLYAPTPDTPASPNPAWQILPASEAEDYAVGRPEKFLYGSTTISAYSAFTIYTNDYQRFRTPRGGYGYRQTYSIRTGETVP